MKQTMKQIEEQNRNQNSKLNPRLNQKLEAVNQVYEMIDDIYDSYAGSFGITDAELWVLYALFEHNGDYLQTDICRQWYYSLQTIHTTSKTWRKRSYYVDLSAWEIRKQVYSPDRSRRKDYGRNCSPVDGGGKGGIFSADTGGAGFAAAAFTKHANALKAAVEKIHRPKDAH